MENNDLNGIDIPASFEIDIQLDAIFFFIRNNWWRLKRQECIVNKKQG